MKLSFRTTQSGCDSSCPNFNVLNSFEVVNLSHPVKNFQRLCLVFLSFCFLLSVTQTLNAQSGLDVSYTYDSSADQLDINVGSSSNPCVDLVSTCLTIQGDFTTTDLDRIEEDWNGSWFANGPGEVSVSYVLNADSSELVMEVSRNDLVGQDGNGLFVRVSGINGVSIIDIGKTSNKPYVIRASGRSSKPDFAELTNSGNGSDQYTQLNAGPNPYQDHVKVVLPEDLDLLSELDLWLLMSDGRVIRNENVLPEGGVIHLNGAALPKGPFRVLIMNGPQRFVSSWLIRQ